MGKSIDPMLNGKAGSGIRRTLPALIGSMSLQPAIPWQVALPQSLPPLHRPGSECAKVVLSVENFAANGEHGLNCLCQPRGQPHIASLYGMLTKFLMSQTVWDIQEQAGKNAINKVRIALIHDRSDYDQHILKAFNNAKNDSTFEGREIFVSITSQGWEDCVPLQAADLLAYETFKDAENHVIGRSRRKSLTSILEGSTFGGRSKSFDRDTLQLLRDVIEADASGLPRPDLKNSESIASSRPEPGKVKKGEKLPRVPI
ncbi:MAG: hypothetical protein ACLQLH_06010 [Terracidiphilus sp.]